MLSLSDKKSVIVSTFIPCYASGKQGDTVDVILDARYQSNINLDLFCKYFSQRNLLELVIPVSFLMLGLNLTQDHLEMQFAVPWKIGAFFLTFLLRSLLDKQTLAQIAQGTYFLFVCLFFDGILIHKFISKFNSFWFWSISPSITAIIVSKPSSYRKLHLPESIFQLFMTYVYDQPIRCNIFEIIAQTVGRCFCSYDYDEYREKLIFREKQISRNRMPWRHAVSRQRSLAWTYVLSKNISNNLIY